MIGKTKIAIAPSSLSDNYSSNTTNKPILPKESHHDFSIGPVRKGGKEAHDTDKKCRSPEKASINKGNANGNKSFNTGRWSRAEKRLFLEGLRRHGKGRWKQIGKVVKTRCVQSFTENVRTSSVLHTIQFDSYFSLLY